MRFVVNGMKGLVVVIVSDAEECSRRGAATSAS